MLISLGLDVKHLDKKVIGVQITSQGNKDSLRAKPPLLISKHSRHTPMTHCLVLEINYLVVGVIS
jgi:hypothetical protein